MNIRTQPFVQTFWREMVLVTVATVSTTLLLTIRATSLAVAVMGTNAFILFTLMHLAKRSQLWRGKLRWLNLSRRLGVENSTLADLHLGQMADEAEGILLLLPKAPAELKTYLSTAAADSAAVVARSITLATLAKEHRRELNGLKRGDLAVELDRRQRKLSQTDDPIMRRQVHASLDAVASQIAVSYEHRQAVDRIECELDSAEQTLKATHASLKQLLQRIDTPCPQGGGALHDRLALKERVEDLAKAIGEVSYTPAPLTRDLTRDLKRELDWKVNTEASSAGGGI